MNALEQTRFGIYTSLPYLVLSRGTTSEIDYTCTQVCGRGNINRDSNNRTLGSAIYQYVRSVSLVLPSRKRQTGVMVEITFRTPFPLGLAVQQQTALTQAVHRALPSDPSGGGGNCTCQSNDCRTEKQPPFSNRMAEHSGTRDQVPVKQNIALPSRPFNKSPECSSQQNSLGTLRNLLAARRRRHRVYRVSLASLHIEIVFLWPTQVAQYL